MSFHLISMRTPLYLIVGHKFSILQAGLLPKVEAEVLAVSDLLKKSPTFAAYLSNPTIPRAEKITKVSLQFTHFEYAVIFYYKYLISHVRVYMNSSNRYP